MEADPVILRILYTQVLCIRPDSSAGMSDCALRAIIYGCHISARHHIKGVGLS